MLFISTEAGVGVYHILQDYAMACQVKKRVKPKEFWSKALETGDVIEIVKNNKKYRLGKIVNPVKLVEVLKK